MENNKEISFTVTAKESLSDDIKFIAAFDRKKKKEIWNDVLSDYIEGWKAKNKSVKFPPKK